MFRAGKTLTDDCKAEVAAFKIELGENVNTNLPLGILLPCYQVMTEC